MSITIKRIVLSCIALFCSLSVHAKELSLVVDPWPPYHFEQEDGSLGGFGVEVMEKVLGNMNQPYQLTMKPFARVQSDIKNGKADGSFLSTVNEERTTYAYFPKESVLNSKWLFYIRKEDQNTLKVSAYDDLKGHRIGLVKSYTYTDEFWDFIKKNDIKHKIVSKDDQAFKMLASGRVDFVPADQGNSSQLLKDLNLNDKIMPLTNFTMKEAGLFAIWSKKQVDERFVESFSQALKDFKATDSYKEIHQRYFGN